MSQSTRLFGVILLPQKLWSHNFDIDRELALPLLFHNDKTDTSLTTIITNYNIMDSNSVSLSIIMIIIPIIVTAIPLDGSWRCLYCSGGEAGTWESYTSGETSIPFFITSIFFSQHAFSVILVFENTKNNHVSVRNSPK